MYWMSGQSAGHCPSWNSALPDPEHDSILDQATANSNNNRDAWYAKSQVIRTPGGTRSNQQRQDARGVSSPNKIIAKLLQDVKSNSLMDKPEFGRLPRSKGTSRDARRCQVLISSTAEPRKRCICIIPEIDIAGTAQPP